jgi:arginine/lysine/ornithine decarboxylase
MISMAFTGQESFVPAAEERAQNQAHTFLSLAPTTSASYPLMKSTPVAKTTAAESKPAMTEAALVLATPVVPGEEVTKTRRSSSLSSDGSLMQKRRFLKLGPVHSGEGSGDWSEEVVE